MTGAVLSLVAGALLVYALFERRLGTTQLTGAIVFTGIGLLFGDRGFRVVSGSGVHGSIPILEATLVVVLFTDAMAINVTGWSTERPLPSRLLGIGFPLTMLAGWLLALAVLRGFALWPAALVAAILAPTDAALGQAVISDPRAPVLIRHALNVESGLNDGLALPFVTIFLALSLETEEHLSAWSVVKTFLLALVASGAIGVGTGWLGVTGLRWSTAKGWTGRHWQSLGLLATALLAFGAANAIRGSGFIAAWAAGFTAGIVARGQLRAAAELPAELADLGMSVSFVLFGAFFLGPAVDHASWATLGYAVLSLTVVRMVPVAISMLGTRLSGASVLYLGWFGPRGLASVVFVLFVVEDALPTAAALTDVVLLTVGLSVLLHGVTARSGAGRYAAWYERARAADPGLREAEDAPVPHRPRVGARGRPA